MARSFVVMSLVMFSDGMMAAYAGADYASESPTSPTSAAACAYD